MPVHGDPDNGLNNLQWEDRNVGEGGDPNLQRPLIFKLLWMLVRSTPPACVTEYTDILF